MCCKASCHNYATFAVNGQYSNNRNVEKPQQATEFVMGRLCCKCSLTQQAAGRHSFKPFNNISKTPRNLCQAFVFLGKGKAIPVTGCGDP
jgi:hypothetical protein